MHEEMVDIEALKKDPEFLENLKRLEQEMHDKGSIARGYQVLDAKLAIEAEEEEINGIFTFIVNTAFDRLSVCLTEPRRFDMADPEDFATARAIYEHGIQRYSENDTKGAKEIFLVLYHMFSAEALKEAMMVHACAVMSGKAFDSFIDEIADASSLDPQDPLSCFITEFVQPTDMLLAMWAEHVKQGKEELKVLQEHEAAQKR